MPISPKSIKNGHCYKAGDQHRRVIEVNKGKVIYESWGGKVKNYTGPLHRNTVSKKKFANDVDESISCPTGMKPLSKLSVPRRNTAHQPVKSTSQKGPKGNRYKPVKK